MILPLQYWPSLSWTKQLLNEKNIQFEQWGTYQKQSLANRCKITGANGPVTLSVPLIAGREQKNLLRNVKVDNTQRWPVQHLRTLRSCYGKAPFFDHYFPAIENVLTKPFELLIDLNQAILMLLLHWLKIPPEVKLTESFQPLVISTNANDGFITQPYLQVFNDKNGFVSDLSVLDAIFCLGPQMTVYLKA